VNDELVGATEKDLRRQVPALFATEGALNVDGLKRELPDAVRHVAAASLAGDHEQSPLDGWESEGHFLSIGEYEAKMVWRSCGC
jgi:hypothetical protein